MNRKVRKKKSDSDILKFIEYRKELTSFEAELEAAKLVEHTASIDTDKAYQRVRSRINNKEHDTKHIALSFLTRVAAVLALPLLVFTIWSLFFQENSIFDAQDEITWQEIQSPAGMRSHIVLPDGTHLWLNAGSSMRYSIPFTHEKRIVELSGEAFLDVAENENSPFIVKAENAEVEVLGTQFNVNAWPETNNVDVVVKEGRVKFRFSSDEGAVKYADLRANDYLQFSKKDKSVRLENTSVEKYIAWHQNIMILDDTPMTELATMLEKWYGVKVVIADEQIKRYKFTTVFDNESLHRVLELLEMSSPGIDIHYETGKSIEGTRMFSNSIVTITKNSQ